MIEYGYVPLSRRQREILGFVADGDSSKEAATKMHISVETVRTLRKQVIQRLNARNMYHAVSIAHKVGIL